MAVLMHQWEVFEKYELYSDELSERYDYMQEQYRDDGIEELMELRGYSSQEMLSLLNELNVGVCEVANLDAFGEYNMTEELGLISKSGNFILDNRYIIPVYDMEDRLVTLIGYFPDSRKYITVPTPFFSKDVMFFNFSQAYRLSWRVYGGFVILVEGIFDCLALRSIGLPAIATMGSTVGKTKGECLKLFSKVLAIPDDDKVGRRSLNRYGKYGWKVPDNTTFLRFVGGEVDFGGTVLHCKDMDNLVSWYDMKDVRDILLSYRKSKEDIEELVL